LERASIEKYLDAEYFGSVVHCFDEIDSTNSYLKSIADEAAEGTVAVAERQSAGRGRQGRSWESETGKNLTFSVILKPDLAPELIGLLPICTGVALAEAVEKTLSIRPECKWPNDLLLNGKKFCGILCESLFHGDRCTAVVAGVGMNVNQRVFPAELAAGATSLAVAAGHDVSREELLARLLSNMERWHDILKAGRFADVRAAWRSFSPMLGSEVTLRNRENAFTGIAEDIDTDGALILSAGGVRHKYYAGDVTLGKNR